MKEIQLTQGKIAIVDEADYEYLNQFSWFVHNKRMPLYASRRPWLGNKTQITVLMHREIMAATSGLFVDHIDGNGLNNQRENLRFCTHSENLRNRSRPNNNTSGYKGVFWHKGKEKWSAAIGHNNRLIHLGTFTSPLDAALAYDVKCREIHGAFAITNFPLGTGVQP